MDMVEPSGEWLVASDELKRRAHGFVAAAFRPAKLTVNSSQLTVKDAGRKGYDDREERYSRMAGHAFLYRELVWFGLAGPIFGASCALLAREWGRRPGVWFVLGFFFTASAFLVLVVLHLYDKPTNTNGSSASKSS
jgi:hypothetical protein